MDDIGYETSSGNVFADMGFTQPEAKKLTAQTALILATRCSMAGCTLRQRQTLTV